MLKSLQRKTIGDLRANWGQFFAVWLVVTLGTAFYGAMYPAAVNLVNSVNHTYDQQRFMDIQVQLDTAQSPDMIARIREIPGITGVEGRLIVESGIQADPDQQYLVNLRLISVPDDRPAEVNRNAVVQGDDIQASRELLVLESFAKAQGIAPGDRLHVIIAGERVEFRVAGLVFNPEYLVNSRSSASSFPSPSTFGVAWGRYQELAELSGRSGEINDIAVRLAGNADDDKSTLVDAASAELAALFPTAAIYDRDHIPSSWMIQANVNGAFPIMQFFSGLFLVGATLITGILMARVVESERRRIGTMRAMGVTRRELVQHYLSFGFLIGVTGGLVGSVLGYFNSFWFMYSFLDNIAGGTLPGFSNTPQIPFILLGFVIVIAGTTLSGVYPAWVMSGTPPGIALRPTTPHTPNAISRIQLGFLPLPVRQAVRNLLRSPGRAFGTMLGVMAGAMMVFSALAMWDTLVVNFDDFFASTAFDMRVELADMQMGDTVEAQMEALEHVTGVQAALIGEVAVVQPDGSLFSTAAVAVDEADPYFDLTTVAGDDAFSRTDGVWIGNNLARVLDIDVGDTIVLRAFDRVHDVYVNGIVLQALGSPIFVPRSLFMQWVPGGVFPVNAVLLRVEAGTAADVREAVVGLPGVRAVEWLDEFDTDINGYLDYYLTNTILFGSFGLILTLALVFNTVNASLRERREELSILRALGTRGSEIALMVTFEFLVMVIIGIVIGAPLGRAAGFNLATSYDMDYYGILATIKPWSYIIGVGGVLLVVLVAEIPGLRAVQRADLGAVCKSQSF